MCVYVYMCMCDTHCACIGESRLITYKCNCHYTSNVRNLFCTILYLLYF